MNERRVGLHPVSLLRFLPRVLLPIAIAVVVGLVAVLIGLRLVEGSTQQEARALIVARNLTISIDELPETVEVIYERVGIGSRARDIGGLDVDPTELTTDRVEVAVVASTPTVLVIGRDEDAALAAAYANAVSEALVEVLNDTGAVGQFRIVEPASAERADEEARLPVVPISILAGLLAGIGTLVGAFVLQQPIYRARDMAAISTIGTCEEIWVSPTPPVEGKVRPLAAQLSALGSHWRLVQCGWGEDLTQPIEALVLKQAPQLRFLSDEVASGLPDEAPWRVAILALEGTPSAELRQAEENAGPRLAAVGLIHPRLA